MKRPADIYGNKKRAVVAATCSTPAVGAPDAAWLCITSFCLKAATADDIKKKQVKIIRWHRRGPRVWSEKGRARRGRQSDILLDAERGDDVFSQYQLCPTETEMKRAVWSWPSAWPSGGRGRLILMELHQAAILWQCCFFAVIVFFTVTFFSLCLEPACVCLQI